MEFIKRLDTSLWEEDGNIMVEFYDHVTDTELGVVSPYSENKHPEFDQQVGNALYEIMGKRKALEATDVKTPTYQEQAGNFLAAHVLEQRRVVHELCEKSMDDPRVDIMYRHECSKLYMLESIMIDAGANIQRTVAFADDEGSTPIDGTHVLRNLRVTRDGYTIQGAQNEANNKVSFWISKRGCTDAYYCFSATSDREFRYQINNGWDGYVRLFESQHSRLGKKA